MILEDIGVEPSLFSEATQVQLFVLPGGCNLLIPVKSELHAQKVKRKLEEYYGANNANLGV